MRVQEDNNPVFPDENRLLLALETSGRFGSVCLHDKDSSDCIELNSSEGSAKWLAPAIASILQKHKKTTRDLAAVAVTIGPGSFTGLRVGVATAKVLAYGLGIPVVGVDTLEAMAWAASQSDSMQSDLNTNESLDLWTLLDAYRGELFVAKWILRRNQFPQCAIPSRLLSVTEWLTLTESSQIGSSEWIVGQTLPKILKLIGRSERFKFDEQIVPTASEVAGIALRMWKNGETTNAFKLMPNYLRRSAAEEKVDPQRG